MTTPTPIPHPSADQPKPRWQLLAAFVCLALLAAACTKPKAEPAPSTPTSDPTSGPATTSIGTVATTSPGPPIPELKARLTEDWSPLGEPGVGGRLTDLAVDPNSPTTLLAGGDLLGVARSGDGGATWQTTFGLAGSEISRFTFNPAKSGEVWAATMSGPHRSLDAGRTWQLQREGMGPVSSGSYTAPIDRVIFDPDRTGRLLAFGGSHREWDAPGRPAWGVVWESTDSGATWSRLSTVAEGANLVDSVRLADGTLWVAALTRGLFRSTDGGRSWTAANVGLPHQNVRAIAAHPRSAQQLWVTLASSSVGGQLVPGGVYQTSDGGATWRTASAGLSLKVGEDLNTTSRYYAIAVSRSDPTVLYTADLGWGLETIYRSVDSATTWTKVLAGSSVLKPAYGTPPTAEALAIDPTNAAKVYAGNAEYIVRSIDGGKSWADQSSSNVGTGTWRGTGFSGLVANRVRFDPKRSGVVVLCGFDGANPLFSDDGGNIWRRPLAANNLWGGCADAAVAPSGRWFVLAGQTNTFGGVGWFDPADGRWQLLHGAPAGLPAIGALDGALGSITVATSPDGIDAILVTLAGRMYRSVDNGTTYRLVPGLSGVGDVAGSGQPAVVYAATSAGVVRSGDAGATFSAPVPGPGPAARLTIDQTGSLYAAVWQDQGGGVWKLNSADNAWRLLVAEPTAYEVAVDPRDPARLLVATNDHPFHDVVTAKGILQSRDAGATWVPTNDGLPLFRVSAVAFDPHNPGLVVVGTFGRGHFAAELKG